MNNARDPDFILLVAILDMYANLRGKTNYKGSGLRIFILVSAPGYKVSGPQNFGQAPQEAVESENHSRS